MSTRVKKIKLNTESESRNVNIFPFSSVHNVTDTNSSETSNNFIPCEQWNEVPECKIFKLQLKKEKKLFVAASQLIWKIESCADRKKFVCWMLQQQI